MEATVLPKDVCKILKAINVVLLSLLSSLWLLVYSSHDQCFEVSTVDVALEKAGVVGVPGILAEVFNVLDLYVNLLSFFVRLWLLVADRYERRFLVKLGIDQTIIHFTVNCLVVTSLEHIKCHFMPPLHDTIGISLLYFKFRYNTIFCT